MQAIIAALRSRADLVIVTVVMLIVAALWWRGNHYRDARDLWRTTAQTQADATRTAMAAAAIRAQTARLETERRYAAHARKADHEEPPAIADLRTSAHRYADAHRLRGKATADCGLPSSTATSAQNGPAPDRDRPGADALEETDPEGDGAEPDEEMIVIPRTHFDQLTGNTLRLERVRIWGEGLIADGLAQKEEAWAEGEGQ